MRPSQRKINIELLFGSNGLPSNNCLGNVNFGWAFKDNSTVCKLLTDKKLWKSWRVRWTVSWGHRVLVCLFGCGRIWLFRLSQHLILLHSVYALQVSYQNCFALLMQKNDNCLYVGGKASRDCTDWTQEPVWGAGVWTTAEDSQDAGGEFTHSLTDCTHTHIHFLFFLVPL